MSAPGRLAFPLGDAPGWPGVLTGTSGRAPAGRGLDSGYAQDFCQSLEEAGPEIRACVDACNHIANATREQNDFSSVSRGRGGTGGYQGRRGQALSAPSMHTHRRTRNGSWWGG